MRRAYRKVEDSAPRPKVSGKVIAFDRLRRDPAAARLVGLVARARAVPVLLLLHRSRCSAEVAETRQLAMYLMHVVLQRSYEEVGRAFGRDRTTVSHACAAVEDRREDGAFDAAVEVLERQVALEAAEEAQRAAGE